MRILDSIYFIPGGGNSYLIERENHCILIDTGASRKAKSIIRAVKSFCPDKPLAAVIITHAHYDHLAGLESIGLLFGPEVISHHEESKFIMKLEKMPTREGIIGFFLGVLSDILTPKNYTVDRVVTNGEVIYDLKIHHSPGHTPGTIALEDTITGALFTGDVVVADGKGKKIRSPSKLFALNYEQALKSSKQLLKHRKPTAILPGHGKPILNPERAIKLYLGEDSN